MLRRLQLSQARDSLVVAETSKVHLQERVEQLTRQLQGNEEKLSVYERRMTGASGAAPVMSNLKISLVNNNLNKKSQSFGW